MTIIERELTRLGVTHYGFLTHPGNSDTETIQVALVDRGILAFSIKASTQTRLRILTGLFEYNNLDR